MKTLTVKTEKSYSVTISDNWDNIDICGNKVCVLSDSIVAPLYLEQFCALLTNKQVYTYIIPSGEQSKNVKNYVEILSFLAKNQFTRYDSVVALGGGVVGDLAGFVAATFMRGINFYQVPTTLLAMTDASVGGKTAIDLVEGKNLVGAFYQPKGVFINIQTLKTLPQKELQNGWGEVVKYAFLSADIEKELSAGITEQLIYDCVQLKANIVADDEKESGKRMLLNLGHTVGHAIETLSSYALPHGLCVAKGLAYAIDISQKYYALSQEKVQSMKNMLIQQNFDLSQNFTKNEILTQIKYDKKATFDGINFVMIRDIGHCSVEKISFKQLEELL